MFDVQVYKIFLMSGQYGGLGRRIPFADMLTVYANLEWKIETEAKKEKNVINLQSKEKF